MKRIYLFLIILAVISFSQRTDAQVIEADSLALVDIYNAGDGANWTGVENWLVGDVGTWTGVVIDAGTKRVTELYLNYINFGGNGGTLSPSIGDLTELTRFEVQEAPTLTGSIPAQLWNCTKIGRLQLKFTGLTGGIPAGIETMVNAYELNFQQSYLGGSIPPELFELPALEKAYLHQSNFTGTVPSTVTGAMGLNRLYLHENKLEGPLPFVDLPTGQAKVVLTGNFFSFEDVKQYHDSAATFSSFTDDYQLSQEVIDEVVEPGAESTMTGTVTGGEAYAWFKDAGTTPVGTSETLVIASVGFDEEGTYTCKAQSSQVANFDIRTIYELSMNYTGRERDSLALVAIYDAGDGANWVNAPTWLTDSIDNWEGVTVTGGRVTQLGLNQINFGGNGGTLSPMIGQLTALTRFEIQDAPNLTGSIPAELWNCTDIGRLQLKFTGLTGGIPAGIESMVNAYELNFQQSYLGGSIPPELFQLPSLEKAYLHQSNFTGTVPSTLTEATGLDRLYLQENKLEGPLPFENIANPAAAKVNLGGNFFTYEDVKPYHDSSATYSSFTDDFQYAQDTMFFADVDEGSSVTFDLYVKDGEAYAWFKGVEPAPISSDTSYTLDPVALTDTGTYVCKVQNAMVANFDIRAAFVVENIIALPVSPVLQSAYTSETGTMIYLDFDMDMADASAEAASFTVNVNDAAVSVSSAATDDTDASLVILTLAEAVPSSTDVVTVSYAPGTLQSTEGGMVDAFDPATVTNNVPTGIGITELIVDLFPNPFNDVLHVNAASVIESVEITNLSGKVLIRQSGSDNTVTVSVSELDQGIYFISVRSADKLSVQKLTKF
jgi:hypothetical protein